MKVLSLAVILCASTLVFAQAPASQAPTSQMPTAGQQTQQAPTSHQAPTSQQAPTQGIPTPGATGTQNPPTDIMPVIPGANEPQDATKGVARIEKEVRHELLMIPRYSLFDDLRYRVVNGDTVELLGNVITVGLKSDAENAVKKIEGVERVINHINELPPSPADDRIRIAMARSISNTANLGRYFWEAAPSIHIIVNNGHVTLTGFVDNPGDKQLAYTAASQVPGVFSVDNQLLVRQQ